MKATPKVGTVGEVTWDAVKRVSVDSLELTPSTTSSQGCTCCHGIQPPPKD